MKLVAALLFVLLSTSALADGPRLVRPGFYEVPHSWAAGLSRVQRAAALAWARKNGVRWRIVQR